MHENGEYFPRRISFQYDGAFKPNIINIDLLDHINNDGERYCEIELETVSPLFKTKNDKIKIEYQYFDDLYRKLAKMNFNELLIKAGAYGLDGSNLKIYLEHGHNYLEFNIWCHDTEIKNRCLEEINQIFNDLLEKFKINKDLILNYLL